MCFIILRIVVIVFFRRLYNRMICEVLVSLFGDYVKSHLSPFRVIQPELSVTNIPLFKSKCLFLKKKFRRQTDGSHARDNQYLATVAYPGFFLRGWGFQQIQLRTENRQNGDLGA